MSHSEKLEKIKKRSLEIEELKKQMKQSEKDESKGKDSRLEVRIEKELKNKAAEILKSLGMTHSQFITMSYKQLVMNEKIPFEVSIKR